MSMLPLHSRKDSPMSKTDRSSCRPTTPLFSRQTDSGIGEYRPTCICLYKCSLLLPSVRISSKNLYNAGILAVLDLTHAPWGCSAYIRLLSRTSSILLQLGVWPAYWMVGPDWPNVCHSPNHHDTLNVGLFCFYLFSLERLVFSAFI